MLFANEQFTLEDSPRAVAQARRWVRETCQQMGRSDLVEAAEIATSELVTNALLHAAPPISLSLRGTRQHPRIEVSDGSTKPPLLPAPEFSPAPEFDLSGDNDNDDLDIVTTFGRGLDLVAMASVAWGAVVTTSGKKVWFEPTPEIATGESAVPVIDFEVAPECPREQLEGAPVRWYGMDPTMFAAHRRQYFGLRSELRLLALAHRDSYPLATEMVALFPEFDRHFPEHKFELLADDEVQGSSLISVSLVLSPAASAVSARMSRLLDLADEFCREELLLSVARPSELREFQTWFLAEVVGQLAGHPPQRWAANVPANAQ